jgi:hypothetical protein
MNFLAATTAAGTHLQALQRITPLPTERRERALERRWSMCLRSWLLVGVVLSVACVSEVKPDVRLVNAVQVSKAEPGPWCRALGAVEGASDMGMSGYVSAYQSLRGEAALLGGNYVVIDHVAGARAPAEGWRDTVIGGRVFACPQVDGFPRVHVMVPDPPEQVSDDNATVVRPVANPVANPAADALSDDDLR